jgi:fibronectin type 3 domain-containing protein/nitrogen regulatory protein PII
MGTKYYQKIITAFFLLFFIYLSLTPIASGDTPIPPSGLSVISGNTEASLTWEPVAGTTEYVVYRSNINGGPYGFIAQTHRNGYADHTIQNGSIYYYVVTALNADGQSLYSSPVEITPTTSVLKSPAGVTVIPGNGAVSLTWNAVTSAVHYNVYRISQDGQYTLLSPAAPGLSYTDRGVTNGLQYYYVIQTMSTKAGAYSDIVTAMPSAALPLAPEIKEQEKITGSTWASLSWTESAGAIHYVVYRGTSVGGPYDFRAIQDSILYEDSDLINGTTYYYVIAAVNENGFSAFSPEVIISASALGKPHAPVLAGWPQNEGVSLRRDPAFGAVSYSLKRSETSGGPYEIIDNFNTSTSYTDRDLSNGTTYYYIVDAHNAGSTSVSSNQISVTPTVSLPVPTNVAVIPGNTQATVTWNPVVGAKSYYIQVADSPGGPSIQSQSSFQPNYTATGLTNGKTYYFRVRTHSLISSNYSDEVSVTPSTALPLAPTVLNSTIGNTQGTLIWKMVDGATGYEIFRRTESSAWSSDPVGTTTGTIFTDTGLINGIAYYYIVAAVNETGTGAWASSVADIIPIENHTLSPTNLVVIPGNTQVTITWDPMVGVGTYRLQIAESSGGPYIINESWINEPNFTATGLTNGRTYYFRVQEMTPRTTAFSAEVSAIPSVALPLAPTSLTRINGNTQGSLTWAAVDGAVGYKVFRRTESSAWSSTPVGTTTGTIFTGTGLTNGITYYYIVAAVNETGTGAWASSDIEITPNENYGRAPTNVIIIPGNTQTTITWKPVVGATSYHVQIAESSGGPYVKYGNTGNGKSSFTATGLTNDRAYYFRVRTDSPKDSAYSTEVSTTPSVVMPLAPTSLTRINGNTQGSLTWAAVDGATGYEIFRRTESSAWSSVPVGTSTGTTFTDTGLINGIAYYYIVAAVNETGTGAWSSSEIEITPTETAQLTPTNVVIFPGTNQATITWDPVAGATRYKIIYATSLNGPYNQYFYSSSTTYIATDLSNGLTHYFWVQTDKGGSLSAYSAGVSTTLNWPSNTGHVVGKVLVDVLGHDDLGVRNAAVSLVGTNFSTITNADGNFNLTAIPTGSYTLEIKAQNLQTKTQQVIVSEGLAIDLGVILMSVLDLSSMFTQDQLNQAVEAVEAAKDVIIAEKIQIISSMFTKEQLDQAVTQAIEKNLFGDINGDGKISIKEAIYALKIASEIKPD